MFAFLSIGYDPSTEQVFAEVKDGKTQLHRIFAGSKVRAGEWFDVKVNAEYDAKKRKSVMPPLIG